MVRVYYWNNSYRIEFIQNAKIKISIPSKTILHSKFHFKLIANNYSGLHLLPIRHEISDEFHTYYFEIEEGYSPISKKIDTGFSKVILEKILDIIINLSNHYLDLSNLFFDPKLIFINNLDELKVVLLPIKNKSPNSNMDILRGILLMLTSLKLEFKPELYSSLLNIEVEDDKVFIRAKNILLGGVNQEQLQKETRKKMHIISIIKEILMGKSKHSINQTTTLISSNRANSSFSILKFVDENLDKYPIYKNNLVLGREEDCDIQIDRPQISRKHLAIHESNSVVQVSDLSSSNGSFINGERMNPNCWYTLKEKDALEIGDYKLWFNRIS